MQDVRQQACHIIDVYELDFVVEILLPARQHARQTLCFAAHSFSARAFSVGCTAKRSQQVILYASSGKDMRTQDIHAASAQRRSTLLHHLVALLFVERIGQRMCRPGRLFGCRRGKIGAID